MSDDLIYALIFAVVVAILVIPVILLIMLSNVLRQQTMQGAMLQQMLAALKAKGREQKPQAAWPAHPAPEQKAPASPPPPQAAKLVPLPVPPPPPPKPAATFTIDDEEDIPHPTPSPLESMMQKIWNWIIINEEHRPKNVSWEMAVASTWLLRMAVIVFVIGIGFFLKYSIAQGFLPPVFRVALAAGTGILMVAGGIRLLNKVYHLLGQGLMGGGFAVLYCTIYAAHHFYSLIPIPAAFALMVLVTIGTGLFSLRYNSLLIAILGIIGGILTPFLFRSAAPNLQMLFAYLLLLNLGVMALAYKRDWPLLVDLAIFSTYGGVWAACDAVGIGQTRLILPFLTAYFLVFNASSLFHQLRDDRKTTGVEAVSILLNTIAYYSLGMMVLPDEGRWRVLFTALLVLFFTGLAAAVWLGGRRRGNDLLLSIFYAIAIFFAGNAVFLYADQTWAVLAWAMLSTLYLWLSKKLSSTPLRIYAWIHWLRPVFHLVFLDFGEVYLSVSGTAALSAAASFAAYLPQILNHFCRFGIPILLLLWCALRPVPGSTRTLEKGAAGLAILLFLIYLSLELFTVLEHFLPGSEDGGLSILWGAYALVLLVAGIRKTVPLVRYAGLALFGVVLCKVFFYDLAELDIIPKAIAFLALGVILFLAALVYVKSAAKSKAPE